MRIGGEVAPEFWHGLKPIDVHTFLLPAYPAYAQCLQTCPEDNS
jgi:hypothetical protein